MSPSAGNAWGKVVSETYSAEAVSYRELWAPLLLPHGERLLDELPMASARSVLDLGCGCGTLFPAIRRRAPMATVVGVDRAAGMLALAPRELARALMDGQSLGFAAGVFDAVVTVFVLFHTREPRRLVDETRRVVKPGGAVATTTWGGNPDFPAHRVWLEELDACGAAADPVTMTDHEPVRSEARVEKLLEAAGFGGIRTWTRPFGHTYTVDQFLELRTKHGANARRFGSLDADAQHTVLDRTRRRLEQLDPSGLSEDTPVISAIAVAC
ncbi:MAG TPA: class I SAM-dependent methyltransferase [Verrucomicrobiae bacterium]|nr:class I SAM-dependent methyltransferase [Verrucomicrobiae bacterium]